LLGKPPDLISGEARGHLNQEKSQVLEPQTVNDTFRTNNTQNSGLQAGGAHLWVWRKVEDRGPPLPT
jgi:hypothetical protein